MKLPISALVLALAIPAAQAQTFFSPDVPKDIPDLGVAISTQFVAADFLVDSLTVELWITHESDGDLEIVLRGPSGLDVTLARNYGGDGDDVAKTVFDDAASMPITSGSAPFLGRFRPQEELSSFAGMSPFGRWELLLADGSAGFDGTLLQWGLTFVAVAIPEPHAYALLLAGLGLLGFAARRRAASRAGAGRT